VPVLEKNKYFCYPYKIQAIKFTILNIMDAIQPPMLQFYVKLLKLYKLCAQITVEFGENTEVADKKFTIDKGIDLWYYSRNKKMHVDLHKLRHNKKERKK